MNRLAVCAALSLLIAGAAPFAPALTAPLAAQDSPAMDAVKKVMDAAGMSRTKGMENATVKVYEVADFQCPFCAKFATEVMGRLDSAFVKTGRVQWLFVNMPLPMHQNAWTASEAAMCAGASNKFWAMHDRLYKNQQEWATSPDPTPIYARYARDAGVPPEPFTSCMASDRVATLIVNDLFFAASAGITGTPTFIVNDEQVVVGNKTFEEWRDIIDAAAKKAAAKKGVPKQ